jgi:2-amino-4-hydroxy-6-hydroxymethyldihydropteridine diphosphokinase
MPPHAAARPNARTTTTIAPRPPLDPTPHPIVLAAARGDLPEWAVAGPRRREHMARVAELLGRWADSLGLGAEDRARWRAAGYLHDALRDEGPETLRGTLPASARDLADAVLHGPAAAERLRRAGVDDEELLQAIASHTLGGVGLRMLGRALYVADYVEPGRGYADEWHARVRERMPAQLERVLREVVRERVRRGRESGRVVASQTLAMLDELEQEGA